MFRKVICAVSLILEMFDLEDIQMCFFFNMILNYI